MAMISMTDWKRTERSIRLETDGNVFERRFSHRGCIWCAGERCWCVSRGPAGRQCAAPRWRWWAAGHSRDVLTVARVCTRVPALAPSFPSGRWSPAPSPPAAIGSAPIIKAFRTVGSMMPSGIRRVSIEFRPSGLKNTRNSYYIHGVIVLLMRRIPHENAFFAVVKSLVISTRKKPMNFVSIIYVTV